MLLFDCMSGVVIGHVEDNVSLCMNQPLLVVSGEKFGSKNGWNWV